MEPESQRGEAMKIRAERWVKQTRVMDIDADELMCRGCPHHQGFRCLVFDERLDDVEGFCLRCQPCVDATTEPERKGKGNVEVIE